MSQLDSVGIAKQASFGSQQNTPEYYPDVITADFEATPELLEVESTVGYQYKQPADAGNQMFKVSMSLIPRVASLPRILSHFLGASTPSTVDTSAKKHAFDPVAAGTSIPYASLLLNRTDPTAAITDLAYDCHGSSLTLTANANEHVKLDVEFLGASYDDSRPEPTVTLDATERLFWHQTKLYANISGGGENELKVKSLEFTYSPELEDDHFILGRTGVSGLPPGTRPVGTLKFTLTEEDASDFVDWYRRPLVLLNRPSIVFRINAAGSLIGAATQKAGFDLKLWNCAVISAPANIDAANRLREIEITCEVNYDAGNSKYITWDVFNVVASY